MDIGKALESDWLKIGVNVREGDHVKFLDEGEYDEGSERYNFGVVVVRNGKAVSQKKFTCNKTNLRATAGQYGSKTDGWVGKEMRVNQVRVRNPKTGKTVESIELSAPNTTAEGEIVLE